MKNKNIRLAVVILFPMAFCLVAGVLVAISQLHGIPFQGKIAVQGFIGLQDSGIFMYDRIFHTIRRITPSSMLVFSPTWSPDGRRIGLVYSDLDRSVFHLATIDVNGGAVHRLVDSGIDGFSFDQDTSLAWSPDGGELLLDAVSDTCHGLLLYEFKEGLVRPLPIKFCHSESGDPVYRLALSWLEGNDPLVGVSYQRAYYYTDDIYKLNISLTKQTWVTHGAYPVWRPGTKDFSFICQNSGANYPTSICLYSTEQGSSTVIAKNYSYDQYTWSPDGKFILYVDKGFRDNDPSLLTLVRLETGQEYRLRPLFAFQRYGSSWWNVGPWIEGKAIWSSE